MILPDRMKVSYKDYLGDDFSLNDGNDMNGFNNIVFHTELVIGLQVLGELQPVDIDIYKNHLYAQRDEHGLYKPKNSHDNMTSKLVGSYMLGLNAVIEDMSLKEMVKVTHILRIWDTIFYAAFLGTGILGWLAKKLLWITSLQILVAIWVKGKVRPHLWERVLWTLQGKKYELRHFQNDGKILGLMKMMAMSKMGCAPFAQRALKMYIDKLGKSFPYRMFYVYFADKSHPVINTWKRVGERPRRIF